MESYNLALFGEAEKGAYRTAYFCKTLPQLVDYLGNPPQNSIGLHFAVQALMYHQNVIFFRVQEEGFSHHDYFSGLSYLERESLLKNLRAIAIPGVGNEEIIQAVTPLCQVHKNLIIISEPDLYDYLTG